MASCFVGLTGSAGPDLNRMKVGTYEPLGMSILTGSPRPLIR